MLDETIERAKRGYNKLVIIVGPSKSKKTDILLRMSTSKGYRYINLSLELSRNLLDIPVKERPLHVQKCIEDILAPLTADIILLDNTELVFNPQLHIDPLGLFHTLSKKRTLVVSWNGQYNKYVLTYAEPNHPEYRKYKTQDINAEIFPLEKEMVP